MALDLVPLFDGNERLAGWYASCTRCGDSFGGSIRAQVELDFREHVARKHMTDDERDRPATGGET